MDADPGIRASRRLSAWLRRPHPPGSAEHILPQAGEGSRPALVQFLDAVVGARRRGISYLRRCARPRQRARQPCNQTFGRKHSMRPNLLILLAVAALAG